MPFEEKEIFLDVIALETELRYNQFYNLPDELKKKYIGFGIGLSDKMLELISNNKDLITYFKKVNNLLKEKYDKGELELSDLNLSQIMNLSIDIDYNNIDDLRDDIFNDTDINTSLIFLHKYGLLESYLNKISIFNHIGKVTQETKELFKNYTYNDVTTIYLYYLGVYDKDIFENNDSIHMYGNTVCYYLYETENLHPSYDLDDIIEYKLYKTKNKDEDEDYEYYEYNDGLKVEFEINIGKEISKEFLKYCLNLLFQDEVITLITDENEDEYDFSEFFVKYPEYEEIFDSYNCYNFDILYHRSNLINKLFNDFSILDDISDEILDKMKEKHIEKTKYDFNIREIYVNKNYSIIEDGNYLYAKISDNYINDISEYHFQNDNVLYDTEDLYSDLYEEVEEYIHETKVELSDIEDVIMK